ncbi:ATP-binding cassette sub-family C member 5-like isoform X1 [Haliotis rufescens]|uniref:ATP-binding cassette sub-family C member 5-like isoform X1 n=2 Tax=Haliotis rufescens TaxID=6454 RepID=UPI00201F50AA|nr:ATP-binding cassette sub-family C member 5-like isoform X1 [Haliotis rufescens]XP_048247432.1 ATP-binding cassette sub-family C member 5-like isoform X1 [Haliotis rufescens]XP_048247433.1 ATP-binding cassette sub-family C member 5-like isoform X1 [Haliotis rufescens]XP_048247434.1 ATP-binding cassette sub-family C member 5-like isoform X1 [Haliotis rufescens]
MADRNADIEERVEDLSLGILEIEAKSEAGFSLSPKRENGIKKYRNALSHAIPVRRGKRSKYEFPLAKAGCFSSIFYSWLSPTMWKVFRKGVDFIENIQILDEDSAKVNSDRFERLWKEEVRTMGVAKSSFARVLYRFVKTRIIVTFFIILIFCAFCLANPIFLIHNFLNYLSQGEITIGTGLAYVAGVFLCEAGRTLTGAVVWNLGYRSGVRVRAGATSFLFKKILRLKSLKNKTVGELVNLVGNDGQRLFEATAIGPLVFCAPFVLLGGSIYAVFLLGPYGLIGTLIFLGFYPFAALISRLTTKFRREGIKVTDKRVRMMSELLTCVKLIKMYAWEKPFAKTISDIRSTERRVLEKGAYVQSLSTSIAGMVPVFSSVITFIAYVASGNELTAAKAFTFVSLLNSMRFSLGVLPYAIKALAEVFVSMTRYKSVLCMEEITPPRCSVTSSNQRIAMQDATFSWGIIESAEKKHNHDNGSVSKPEMNGGHFPDDTTALREADETTMLDAVPEPSLTDITFVLEKGKLLGVCGSVGAGKTSLINAILGRMDLLSGKIAVNGSIAYVPQQAWITNTTVRENILFGLPYNEKRYNEIVRACALNTDFHTFVSGDTTEIGERGLNLSGGQKQRISMARAVYSDSEIYLLDDPLSAVDVHVGQHIANEVLLKMLKGKTVLFITHQLQYLVHCDEVMFLKEGQIEEKGTHDELMQQDREYSGLIKMFYTEQMEEYEEADTVPTERLSSLSTSDIHNDKSANANPGESTPIGKPPPPLERLFSRGAGMGNISPISRNKAPPLERMFSRGAGMAPAPPPLERLFSRGAMVEKPQPEMFSGGQGMRVERQFSTLSSSSSGDGDGEGKLIVAEERSTGTVSKEIYRQYIQDGGGYLVCFGVFLIFFLSVASQTGANWFLSFWLNQGNGNNTMITINNATMSSNNGNISDHPMRNTYTLIYGMFVVMMLVLTFCRAFVFMKATLKASSGLHDRAFKNILASPMEFFDTTPTGRIINRFSADMDEVDIRLPMQAEVFITNVLQVFFSLLMICYMSAWFLVAMIPLVALFACLFVMFVRCARNLKRLDAVTKSPLVSHITASVQGITTIHAYGKMEEFVATFQKLLDTNSVPFFIFYSASRWLSVRLDLLCVCISGTTGLIIVFNYDNITPAVAGLALAFAVQMAGLFQFTVRLAIETESRFTSVQRIQEYAKDTSEEDLITVSDTEPPADWPADGRIVYNRVRMRYREGMPLALKGVTFSVEPQEKIGIVGRSGSGKSSLGVALFRLVEAASGTIVIDGIDISKVSHYNLRSKLAIIPQDPVLFVGTVRYNLDPFSEHAEVSLWDALKKCHVKDTIAGLDDKLDAMVVENGENFSVGERQLLCLARALLRHSKILMLDEATAAIDTETDTLVQTTIKETFSDCTMLIIAHRLNTVLSCDRIMVMEDGKVVEFDKPSALMSKSDSKFKAMLEATEGQPSSS